MTGLEIILSDAAADLSPARKQGFMLGAEAALRALDSEIGVDLFAAKMKDTAADLRHVIDDAAKQTASLSRLANVLEGPSLCAEGLDDRGKAAISLAGSIMAIFLERMGTSGDTRELFRTRAAAIRATSFILWAYLQNDAPFPREERDDCYNEEGREAGRQR
jgi:hypothetical protein